MNTIEMKREKLIHKDIEKIHSPNFVRVSGRIEGDTLYNHQTLEEKFYRMIVKVIRQSGTPDYIPVIVPERLLNEDYTHGCEVVVEGQVRTYNKTGHDGRNHLYVRLFAKEIWLPQKESEENFVTLTGTICRPVIYRTTPFGREISDVILAVNREFGKSDYVPCVIWGRNARFTAGLPVGSRMRITGRFQSRKYTKNGEEFVAFEISVRHLEVPAVDE